MTAVILIVVILAILYFLMIMPRITPRPMHEFKGWYYAHRGGHDNNSDAPENSLKAMRLAVENGYGIELDVQLTRDEKVVVFHDGNLKRVCGIDAKVNSMTYEELQQLRLFDSEEKIPLFSDVLKVIDGKVPLIMEVKMVNAKTRVCELANKELEGYKGIYCMESFHPFAVWWYKKNRPDVVRGQLSANFKKEGQKEGIQEWLVHMLLVNVLGRPDFVAYSHKSANNMSRKLTRMFGATAVAWTIRSQEELDRKRKKFDLFIFEGFRPK
ncbi:MAG: glycerophosphodiester phosphodiesterase [Lachnospiraceae bacterium]|nr:glycerophosphodiester phosphodiesterase [Lachnospiraceae bacterium]